MSVVLDSSALLAFIFHEPGTQMVVEHLDEHAMISAVNWSEVVQKVAHKGKDAQQLGEWVLALGPQVEPFDRGAAYAAAALFPTTSRFGLGLGDRACLTLATFRNVPVLTADQTWAKIPDLGIEVQLIR
ncbi:MAG: type II toxin-antitoxin system VapC family toxin [Nocardioidaceae bacterium]